MNDDTAGKDRPYSDAPVIESLSAVTLATRDMARAIGFYKSLGFSMRYGGPDTPLTSFAVGDGYLNLIHASPDQHWSGWGRVILHVSDVDAMYARAVSQGMKPSTIPQNAEWGERYFHLTDPDGHELSFARPIGSTGD